MKSLPIAALALVLALSFLNFSLDVLYFYPQNRLLDGNL